MICGAAILIPLSLVIDRPWTLAPSANSIVALLGLSIFSTALAFVIFFRLIHTLGTVGTTAQAYLRVPIGVAIGVLFLGETLASTAWIGMACVVVGVAAMTIPATPARRGRRGLIRFTATDGAAPRRDALPSAVTPRNCYLPGCPNRFAGVCCRRLQDEPNKMSRRWSIRGRSLLRSNLSSAAGTGCAR